MSGPDRDGPDTDAAQERLLELLAERARTSAPAQRAALDAGIVSAAAALGLDPEEVASLTPQVVGSARRRPDLAGRFRVMRRGRDFLPFVFGLMLAPAIAGLGAPVLAAVGTALLVVAWVVRGRIRVAVFDIDAFGHIDLHRHGRIDWQAVQEVSFAYRYPWATPAGSLERTAGETAVVRFRLRDGRSLRLAQGQLFQIRPTRQPVGLHRLARFLRTRAVGAGLKVEKLPNGAWRATRS
jgi:hypothetical protein